MRDMRVLVSGRVPRDEDGYIVTFPGGKTEFGSRDPAYVGAAKMILVYGQDLTDADRKRIGAAFRRVSIAALARIYHQYGSAAGVTVTAVDRQR